MAIHGILPLLLLNPFVTLSPTPPHCPPSRFLSSPPRRSGDGWLNKLGVFDYAGGNAVHALSGIVAWVAAKILGPRIGCFDENGKHVELATHNVSFMVLGTFILWLGFIPFIAGSPCY